MGGGCVAKCESNNEQACWHGFCTSFLYQLLSKTSTTGFLVHAHTDLFSRPGSRMAFAARFRCLLRSPRTHTPAFSGQISCLNWINHAADGLWTVLREGQTTASLDYLLEVAHIFQDCHIYISLYIHSCLKFPDSDCTRFAGLQKKKKKRRRSSHRSAILQPRIKHDTSSALF